MCAEQMKALERSIEEFGLVDPVLVRRQDHAVIGGHQRLEAARRLGLTEVPVLFLDLTRQQACLLNIALNGITGEWNLERLGQLLSELRDLPDVDVTLAGLDSEELEGLFAELEAQAYGGEHSRHPCRARMNHTMYQISHHPCTPVAWRRRRRGTRRTGIWKRPCRYGLMTPCGRKRHCDSRRGTSGQYEDGSSLVMQRDVVSMYPHTAGPEGFPCPRRRTQPLVIVTAIVPIFLTVGLGYLLERRRGMDVRALSSICIYVLLPCLIFHSLLTTELTLDEASPILTILVLTTATLWLLGKAVSRVSRFSRDEESFFLLASMFLNAGNMGMPVAYYAFGQQGLELAVIGVLIANFLMNTIAVYYSSRHRGGRGAAVRTVLTLPAIHATVLALLMRNILHIIPPPSLLDPIRMLGLALIPVGQLLLGMQLAKARDRVSAHVRSVMAPAFARLVLGPAFAFGYAMALGFHGLAPKIAILMAGMPTAVNIAIFTTEFGLLPRRAATAVLASTVASFFTLSLLLILLSR
jgi:predicted permease